MKILVTGVNGFVGHHVARQLHDEGHTVIGASNQPDLETDLNDVAVKYYGLDLTSPEEVAKIDLSDIDAIINLAGFAKVGDSIGKGELYNKVNIGVHTILYDECLRQGVSPRILAVSTGAVYDPHQNLPITEDSKLVDDDKTNEYTISKKRMEDAVLRYNERGLDCIIMRPFNHSGPGQLPGFLLPDLGEQIVQAADEHHSLKVGNLETKRDYTDVRDVARAYVTVATCDRKKLRHTIYNICSGKSVRGKHILELLTAAFDVPDLKTETDPSRIRPNDVMEIYGSRDRLSTDTGWQPEISVEQMVHDYVEWKKSTQVA